MIDLAKHQIFESYASFARKNILIADITGLLENLSKETLKPGVILLAYVTCNPAECFIPSKGNVIFTHAFKDDFRVELKMMTILSADITFKQSYVCTGRIVTVELGTIQLCITAKL
jgi:hypothetical protein